MFKRSEVNLFCREFLYQKLYKKQICSYIFSFYRINVPVYHPHDLCAQYFLSDVLWVVIKDY